MPASIWPREREPALDVLRDDPGGEPVARRVGTLDGLVGAVDDLDRGDRAERLRLRELRVRRHVAEQRRAVARPDGLAAREHLRARASRPRRPGP